MVLLCKKSLLIAAQLAATLVLELNRAQTGLAIDDNVLGKCITRDFVRFTGPLTHSNTRFIQI